MTADHDIRFNNLDDQTGNSVVNSSNSNIEKLDSINSLKISHLNLNGCTVRNGELRKEILKSTNADFICINEIPLGN